MTDFQVIIFLLHASRELLFVSLSGDFGVVRGRAPMVGVASIVEQCGQDLHWSLALAARGLRSLEETAEEGSVL